MFLLASIFRKRSIIRKADVRKLGASDVLNVAFGQTLPKRPLVMAQPGALRVRFNDNLPLPSAFHRERCASRLPYCPAGMIRPLGGGSFWCASRPHRAAS